MSIPLDENNIDEPESIKDSLWLSWNEKNYQCSICGIWISPPEYSCNYCGTNYMDEMLDSKEPLSVIEPLDIEEEFGIEKEP